MSRKVIVDFFYDVISPYSYIAFEILSRYNSGQWVNAALRLRPASLAHIMQASGNKPPMMVAAKAAYMPKDIHRQGEHC